MTNAYFALAAVSLETPKCGRLLPFQGAGYAKVCEEKTYVHDCATVILRSITRPNSKMVQVQIRYRGNSSHHKQHTV